MKSLFNKGALPLMHYLLLLSFFLITNCTEILAQETPTKNYTHVSFGAGIGGAVIWNKLSVKPKPTYPGKVFPIQTQLFLQLDKDNNSVKFRYVNLVEAELTLLESSYNIYEQLHEVAILYGRSYRKKKFFAGGGLGVSYNSCIFRKQYLGPSGSWFVSDNYERGQINFIGFPFEATTGVRFGKRTEFGLNFSLLGNISKSSFLGYNMGMQIRF